MTGEHERHALKQLYYYIMSGHSIDAIFKCDGSKIQGKKWRIPGQIQIIMGKFVSGHVRVIQYLQLQNENHHKKFVCKYF